MPHRPRVHSPQQAAASPVERRASARERGYSTNWAKYSKAFLAEHPICFYCSAIGMVSPAQHTDHYTPCSPDSELWFDLTNHRPACSYHNSGKRNTPGDVYLAKLIADHQSSS